MEEFELTFLPKTLPGDLLSFPSMRLLDIYFPAHTPHSDLRVRRKGDSYEITKKQPVVGNDSSHQIEVTIPLTVDEYVELEKIEGKRVSKTRYYYKENGEEYEIDIFEDGLKGLVLVDVEFKSNEEKSTFIPPSWILADVTQDAFVAGGVLAGKSYSEIKDKLEMLGYAPLTFI